ncbi:MULTISPECIES: glutamate synthase-related protein [unclassified Pseudoalteromonas]|nr:MULTISPECIES: glutamate synthase-related protein [unclassified Pseudoalteromonas]MCF2829376.1 glutamate synthase-related protein [Pseudoalteromonas sp. OF5H-5]MCF2834239.1 glutamate synthase-related protein [Pseudoalteromonas sp. DL2-H6]MCF2927093.1 glutamate synthase-related protein [Pseudoalteromonas sp. DL2-H1]
MDTELKRQIKNSIEDKRADIIELIELGRDLASDESGHINHGPNTSMGVPKNTLPKWDDIQLLTAQLAKKPLFDGETVDTQLVIGPRAKSPLVLDIPMFVSDMSYGALSKNAKIALAKGANYAGTGICSGEGGILAEELAANNRYLFEMGTARNGIKPGKEADFFEKYNGKVKAFHFKGGQAAKTGTGGHLPGAKVTKEIAEVRHITEGQTAISPPTYEDFTSPGEFKDFADLIREGLGGVPIGFKISANHIERDIQFALDATADYIILDGRGGSTGSAPNIFRDHISVPTIPALARARNYLDAQGMKKGASDSVTLIITGGLRVPADFIKAMALGADGIALSNSVLQAIGCVGARICNSGNCPAGIATQDQNLVNKLNIADRADDLDSFFYASTHLMQIMARACGHDSLSKFSMDDLTTWHKQISELTGIAYAGVTNDFTRVELPDSAGKLALHNLISQSKIKISAVKQLESFEQLCKGVTLASGSAQAYLTQKQYVDAGYPLEIVLNTLGVRALMRLVPPLMSGSEHRPHLEPYYVGKFQISQIEWQRVTGSTPSEFKLDDNPVNKVTRQECVDFAAKLNSDLVGTGWEVSLPSVEEWIHACRAGTTTQYYSGSLPLDKQGKELSGMSPAQAHSNDMLRVGTIAPPNAYGLYDLYSYIYDFTMTNDFSGQDIYLRGGYYGGFFGSEQHSGSDPNGPAANFKSFRLALRYVGK